MTEVKLIEFEGWTVYVDQWGTFTAVKDEKKLEDKSLEVLKENIKRQNSDDRRFKPIDAIKVNSDMLGRITSRVADNNSCIYWTFKETPEAKTSRTQESLEGYRSWGDERYPFVMATVANREILAKIEALRTQEDAILKEMQTLRKSYTRPVTWKEVDAQGEM